MPLTVRDGIAVVTIENPPVNALGPAAIAPLIDALAEAQADPAVRAVVLTGANGTFSGGADMKTFGANPPVRPHIRDFLEKLEASTKPIVAAIDGNAMGGGLEVALTCDYRVATARARLALPEIQRGLLPGAGGTQRLPRLIGIAAALPIILGGEPVDGTRAKALGIVDELATGDVLDAAVAYARNLASHARRRTSELRAEPDDAAIEAARKKAQPVERGGLAEHRAIDCIAEAASLPFDEGNRKERERFLELVQSEQAKARIHIFFAEREAAKLPDGSAPPPFSVKTVAIIGSGTMGSGIAMACANAGITVTLIDLQQALLDKARGVIAGNYAATMKKGRLTEAQMNERLGRITYATSLDAVANNELIIEAVFEEMGVKQDVFRQIDRIASPGTILASNTSTLDIDAIAGVTSRPQDVIGLHFFSPANVMKLLEIVRGAKTSPATIAKSLGFAKQIKKVGVVAGNCDGFIGNRMLAGYGREAAFVVEEGATPEQVDRVIKNFGLAMGPFAMGDLAGLDVGWRIRKGRNAISPPTGRYSKVADRLCEMGRFGQKTGAGYYRYEPGDRTPHPDPVTTEVIETAAREAGITRRAVGDDEILKRCMYPLVNEAAKILEEGIATRPGDVDVVWIYGYGFPAFRGGPLRWADSLGLANVVADMRAFAKEHGDAWEPAPLLQELAASGGTFGAWKGRTAAHA